MNARYLIPNKKEYTFSLLSIKSLIASPTKTNTQIHTLISPQLKQSQTNNTRTLILESNLIDSDPKKMENGSHPHPYIPKDMILPNYVPCFLSQSNILSVYASFTLILFSLTWIFSG